MFGKGQRSIGLKTRDLVRAFHPLQVVRRLILGAVWAVSSYPKTWAHSGEDDHSAASNMLEQDVASGGTEMGGIMGGAKQTFSCPSLTGLWGCALNTCRVPRTVGYNIVVQGSMVVQVIVYILICECIIKCYAELLLI